MKHRILSVLVIVMLVLGMAPAMAEGWDCPNCGQSGNTSNFCQNCAMARPDSEEQMASTQSSGTTAEDTKTAEEMYEIGEQYFYGDGVEQSYEKAVEWYSKAAEQGYAAAQCVLGYIYENGYGVEQSYMKALSGTPRLPSKGIRMLNAISATCMKEVMV